MATLRKTLWTSAAVLAVLAMATCSDRSRQPTGRKVIPWTPQERAAFSELKNSREVKDLLFEKGQSVEWFVGVLNPRGGRRFGYAQYVCNVLHSHHAAHSETRVRLIDVYKLTVEKAGMDGAEITTVDCATFRASDLN